MRVPVKKIEKKIKNPLLKKKKKLFCPVFYTNFDKSVYYNMFALFYSFIKTPKTNIFTWYQRSYLLIIILNTNNMVNIITIDYRAKRNKYDILLDFRSFPIIIWLIIIMRCVIRRLNIFNPNIDSYIKNIIFDRLFSDIILILY